MKKVIKIWIEDFLNNVKEGREKNGK